MPHGHEIQRRIGWSESAAVEHAYEVFAAYEQVPGNDIFVTHNGWTRGRQFTHPSPHTLDSANIE